jgi:hypothetical protein
MNLQDIGLALSSFIGNGGQAYATGLSALVYQKTTQLQGSVRDTLYKLGRNLGPVLGTAIPEQIAAGAEQSGGSAVQNFEQKTLGFSISNLTLGISLVVGGLVIWMLIRLLRK